MSNYPALHGVNSSCCEQYHSFLRRLKRSATNMNQPNFMRLMRSFVNLWNGNVCEKMQKP